MVSGLCRKASTAHWAIILSSGGDDCLCSTFLCDLYRMLRGAYNIVPCSKPDVKVLTVSGEPVSVKDLTTTRTVMALLRHLG